VPPERQIDFNNPGTWVFLLIFLMTGIMGIMQIMLAFQNSNKLENK